MEDLEYGVDKLLTTSLLLQNRMKRKITFLKPKWLQKYTAIYNKNGFKEVIKKGGYKILIYFFLFYLIRDAILYLIIPYLIGKEIISLF